ncbi:apoptotic chromatin condensation inducer in the nucleus [Scleropages formosus]|uniref:SAP domain-containing protein n=1 Tax=Scleropages formosus TaxID=113540 RepID=A0A8C9W360_SCLFO|nr:apoptotic chromatin condensation inducer in the nucleus [Scleropages formosus]
MAELEDVTLDGRPLHSLRVADLKAALEQRGLPKSGQKNALIKRLKGALMLENLQRTSTPHIGLQPNSQIGEEMSQNSFIKQYLAKQQELLRQRLEREAREAAEADETESPKGPDRDEHSADNDSTHCTPSEQVVSPVQDIQKKLHVPSAHGGEGDCSAGGVGEEEHIGDGEHPQSSAPPSQSNAHHLPHHNEHDRQVEAMPLDPLALEYGAAHFSIGGSRQELRDQQPAVLFSPAALPRAVASLSVRVVGEPERAREANPCAAMELNPGRAPVQPVQLEQAARVQPESDEDSLDDNEDNDTEEHWRRTRMWQDGRGEPSHNLQARNRSRHMQQMPQHVSPQLSHQPQLRHPTPPPSPPPELLYPLPDTPKQSPPNAEEVDGVAGAGVGVPMQLRRERSPSPLQHQDSSSCSPGTSSSPEPQGAGGKRKPGPLTLLARKMESEGVFAGGKVKGQPEFDEPQVVGSTSSLTGASAAVVATVKHVDGALFLSSDQMGIDTSSSPHLVSAALPTITFAATTASAHSHGVVVANKMEESLAFLDNYRNQEESITRQGEERFEQEKQERDRLEKEVQKRELEMGLEKERQEQDRIERERLEKERLERETLERERLKKEQVERERQERDRLEKERVERERLERERLERERLERERLERERLERERLERERLERERLERERLERVERERLERERLERERLERVERERLERERLERERLEKERLERERLEKERLERERLERERLERERLERERLERERLERERLERERLERERLERERLERERLERERLEKERLERERLEEERLERERLERERLEQEQLEERLEKKDSMEQKRVLRDKTLEMEKAAEREQEEQEMEQERVPAKEESCLPPWKRGREFGGPSSSLQPAVPEVERSQDSIAKEMKRQEPVMGHLQLQVPASQPSLPLSPQSSAKKFRFLRESQQPSSPSSTVPVIRRPRTFSDTPPSVKEGDFSQAAFIEKTSITVQKDMESETEGPFMGSHISAVIASKQALMQTPIRQGVLVAASQHTPEVESLYPKTRSLAEKGQLKEQQKPDHQEQKDETKRILAEVPRGTEVKGLSALPLSTALEDAETERQLKGQSSTPSDSSSSDSDSESSSSRSSGSSSSSTSSSSSSQDQSPSDSSNRKSASIQKGTRVSGSRSQREKSKTHTPPRCKKTGPRTLEEEEGNFSTDGKNQAKKPCLEQPEESEDEQNKVKDGNGGKEIHRHPSREVKPVAMELPDPEVEEISENSEVPAEESTTAKTFPVRKISLSTSKPAAVSTMGSTSACTPVVPAQESPAEGECAGPGSRKRRWGSSTAVTAKKPSISITTDSLKSLIPDIKHTVSQEAVVDLHADEGHLSVEDDASERDERGGEDLDPGLTIRRTVTQVVLAESQENGQRDAKREEEAAQESKQSDEAIKEEHKDVIFQVPKETEALAVAQETETTKVVPSDMLVRRSISQQKSGVSVTIDDPVRSAKQPSPPRGNITNIIHICNLVRPFTLGQLKELLNRTGAMLEEGFWIDKIKSHCYVTYPSTEEAVATRTALHGVKWPQSNPKFLNVDFAQQDELDFHRGLLVPDQAREESGAPPPRPERDQWAEREREMERRERTRAEREWDRDKVRDFGKPSEERRSRSRDRERRRKERKEKKEKGPEEPPAKLLDDLFCKTKAAPCIYWLPLTEEQAAQREMERAERMKEREKRRKELQEEEDRKREEERKERMKAREKQAGPSTGAPSGSSRGTGDAERDQDKRREGHRSRAPGGSAGGQGSSRRSRSRSNPPGRDRRH